MDFAPYQSSPPENSRPFSPPRSTTASPRTSYDYNPYTNRLQRPNNMNSPPPLQHPQPQRQWNPTSSLATGTGAYYKPVGVEASGGVVERGLGVSEFDTSLGLRLDYEAAAAYLLGPPVGAIVLLILERKSDYVRFHAWQSSLLFTTIFIIHLIFSWSTFLSWVFFLGDLALMACMALKAYRDADTLDRYEIAVFGQLASRFVDDE
ncbi:uncharacterized protein BCR38DRAFT_238681 [Pseudomassariella vexata]|uniref:Uncharacterized protein n=1 Tax=Pseudomassariella vexata TaxID=1141098 RepID=A0A1Y2DT85_9PEZI|nr:uncharacterized protein BCR38DRAFT_238681 [Pseudomassariella vexata]ORY62379.1 hypothetical protein BCR38DRAFT_238681 [Pseudomassariella vexata]